MVTRGSPPAHRYRYRIRYYRMVRATLILALLIGGCTQQSGTDLTTTAHSFDTALPDSAQHSNSPPPTVRSDAQTRSIAESSIGDSVQILFSEPSYRFSVAEVADGIEIPYEIVVHGDVANVLPLSQHSQSNVQIDLKAPPALQGCVLEPFGRLNGNEQFYGEFSPGCLAMPMTLSPSVLRKGRYSHSFKWNGRNLSGDGGGGSLPFGSPFPRGEYVLNVRCIGKLVTNGVPKKFEITKTVALTLTE